MIRVIIPFYNEFETVKPALVALRNSGIEHDVLPVQGPIIANNRNRGVTLERRRYQKLTPYYSHYLFVDSDIAFTVADLNIALGHEKEILSLPYLRHQDDYTYQAARFAREPGFIEKYYTRADKGLQQIDFTGAGFLLVTRDALQRLAYPWFHHRVVGGDTQTTNCGEDVGFCLAAREAGVPIFCDFDRPVYHRLRTREEFNVYY